VVIVGKDPDFRADLAEMLTAEGIGVIGQAADGDQAVAVAGELRPDLVLMDVALPELDTATSALTAARVAPVLLLTAAAHPPGVVEQARDAGAMAAVSRPFSAANLLPAIEVSIARYTDITVLCDMFTDITERLQARKVIERAKGMLMAKWAITEPDAFRWLQRTAMDHRTSMLQVATAVIDNHHAAVTTGATTTGAASPIPTNRTGGGPSGPNPRPKVPPASGHPGAAAAGPASVPAGRR